MQHTLYMLYIVYAWGVFSFSFLFLVFLFLNTVYTSDSVYTLHLTHLCIHTVQYTIVHKYQSPTLPPVMVKCGDGRRDCGWLALMDADCSNILWYLQVIQKI